MSRLAATRDDLRADWGRLQARWDAARQHWRDEVADTFERGRWQDWEETVPAYLRALQELDQLANRVSREIE
jgi:uncharacterized protein YukE